MKKRHSTQAEKAAHASSTGERLVMKDKEEFFDYFDGAGAEFIMRDQNTVQFPDRSCVIWEGDDYRIVAKN